MFADIDWGAITSKLVTAGTSYVGSQAEQELAKAQAQLVEAQKGLVSAQAELSRAQTAQAGVGGFDMSKMGPVLLLGIGFVLFLTFKEGSRKRR